MEQTQKGNIPRWAEITRTYPDNDGPDSFGCSAFRYASLASNVTKNKQGMITL